MQADQFAVVVAQRCTTVEVVALGKLEFLF